MEYKNIPKRKEYLSTWTEESGLIFPVSSVIVKRSPAQLYGVVYNKIVSSVIQMLYTLRTCV
jgi:hypothetical protein